MDIDSKILYQYVTHAYDRLKLFDSADSHHKPELEKIEALTPIYRSILEKVPPYLVKNNRNVPFFYYFYGLSLYFLNKDGGNQELIYNAVRLIKKAIQDTRGTDALEYIKALIEILIAMNKNAEALSYCQQVTRISPGDKHHLELGIELLLKMNRTGEAIYEYEKLIHADPFSYENYTKCGKLYLSKKDYDSAFRMFKKSRDVEPKYPDNYRFMGKILLIKNRQALAGSNFKTAIARKIYNHEQYQNNVRRKQVKVDPADNESNTLLFLFDCYLNLVKCGENFIREVNQTQEKLFLKGYMDEEKLKKIRSRFKV